MKKSIKLIFVSTLALLVSACQITLYNPNSTPTNTTTDDESSGPINVINATDYHGTITYAPDSQTLLAKEEVYQQGVQSAVYVIATKGETLSLGSGVVFSEDSNTDGYAYIFTNAHVVKGSSYLEVIFSNYKRVVATIVGYNTLEDVAVIKVKKSDNYRVATIKERSRLQVGEEVVTIGTPVGTEYSFLTTSGVLSKINSPMKSSVDTSYSLLLLQIDAALNSGNSGGPLFDMYGNLIGLNTMKLVYDDSLNVVYDFNFAIPADRAAFIANTFFANTPYERGLIGVTVSDITNMDLNTRRAKGVTLDYGLYVVEVSETGAANGLVQVGDIITKINNKSFLTQYDFQAELYNTSKNNPVTLTVYRNGEYQNINVTLR